MRRTLVIAVLAFTAASIAPGQKQSASGDQRSSVEQAIKQLDNERIQAQIGADAAALDRIYADDFIGIGPSGTVRTKPQVLADFTSHEFELSVDYDYRGSHSRIRKHGRRDGPIDYGCARQRQSRSE